MWASKSASLAWLSAQAIAGVAIPRFFAVPVACALRDGEALAAKLGPTIAVRSDRLGEGHCDAGRWRSVLDVPSNDALAVRRAIQEVVDHYDAPNRNDNILLQRQVTGADVAGVARSHALPDAPYVSISLIGGSDNRAVTAASAAVFSATQAHNAPVGKGPFFGARRAVQRVILEACKRSGRILDMEWFWKNGRLCVVQLRAGSVCPGRRPAPSLRIREFADRPDQVLAQMSDWNPAELLGEHPRPMALSLFRYLISDRTWREARAALGYAPASGSLLACVGGRPYVRVASSFASLLPATLPKAMRERIVGRQLQQLARMPTLHDQIEFACALSCFEFGLDTEPRFLALAAEEQSALRAALSNHAPQLFDAMALDTAVARAKIALRSARQWPSTLPAWRRHLAQIRRELALPFAQSARRSFAYEALLRSAVRLGRLHADTLGAWRAAASPLAQTLFGDSGYAWRERLRASTFEITCVPQAQSVAMHVAPTAPLNSAEFDTGLPWSAEELASGFRRAHAARDWGKLALALALSDALEALVSWGADHGLTREDLSWLTLTDLGHAQQHHRVALRRDRHATQARLRLPLVITRSTQLNSFVQAPGAPAFLGRGRVRAATQHVDERTHSGEVVSGRILLMTRCEPGLDWVFATRPSAIVTAFGGPNAHVALRAHELAVPALLGVGPEQLERLRAHDHLDIDFDERRWSGW